MISVFGYRSSEQCYSILAHFHNFTMVYETLFVKYNVGAQLEIQGEIQIIKKTMKNIKQNTSVT